MTTYQTSAQHSETIRFGSAKIEVGETEESLVNLGLATGIKFTEEYTPVVLKPDNAPEIVVGVKDHSATVEFEMWEVNLTNLNLIRGGIDTLGSVKGSPTPVSEETHTLTGTNFVRLAHKNGDGTEVDSIVVKNAADTAAVRNTDYVVAVDEEGYTCIARVADSTVIEDGDSVKVNYTYTPNAATTLSTGGKNTVSARVVRLTNTNAAGKKFEITVYAAKNQGGIELELPADDGDEPLKPTITLKGICDTTREAGDQLFKIVDEQGVSA
jgi:hypothetical protein